jgi:hypothetical protein
MYQSLNANFFDKTPIIMTSLFYYKINKLYSTSKPSKTNKYLSKTF